MSFLGGLFGGSSTPKEQQQDASASSDLLGSTSFRSNVNSSSTPSSTLDADAAQSPTISPVTPAPSAAGMLGSSFDVAKLHPMAELGENLDFLALEDDKLTDVEGAASVLPSRGFTDDLCVGTGTTYLSGLTLGGAWGLKDGLTKPLGDNPSFRLRLNSVLNSCTRRGSFTGNSFGILAIYYNVANSSLDALRNRHDMYNSLAAGALTGALYKSTAGLRPAAVGAAIGTASMGAWSLFKTLV